ncbi:hypothetical protein CAPTEDRAFT_221526 [Capitella teleta]|uniref:Uncharacterized protein n=1 Tax=Capitella teleta TaxID=283909 RepID=R7VJK7_CAPTE|nr:hypothetical protein CAPTEDRAFT_221526 [Capitella teleta]|eukprot:ELU15990.1 hypothetical protein CAPTEDRAFT_221526 [Capitella teleta]
MCPLLFMSNTGKNLTPPELPKASRDAMFAYCDKALCDIVRLLGVHDVVGVGNFAEGRARTALGKAGMSTRVHRIMHPSPANPAAHKEIHISDTNKTTEPSK